MIPPPPKKLKYCKSPGLLPLFPLSQGGPAITKVFWALGNLVSVFCSVADFLVSVSTMPGSHLWNGHLPLPLSQGVFVKKCLESMFVYVPQKKSMWRLSLSVVHICSVYTMCIWCCLPSRDTSVLQGPCQSILSTAIKPRKLPAVLVGFYWGGLILKVMIKCVVLFTKTGLWAGVTQTLHSQHPLETARELCSKLSSALIRGVPGLPCVLPSSELVFSCTSTLLIYWNTDSVE